MPVDGYNYGRTDFAQLLLRKFYPERTDRESGVMRDYLLAHLDEFDAISFSVRVGEGQAPNPDHLPGVQANTVFSSRKRIDMLAWQGQQPFIIEIKERVTPASLGQILTYRSLWLEENPGAKEPRLVVIGRTSDDDTVRTLQAHGVDVFLYETPVAE